VTRLAALALVVVLSAGAAPAPADLAALQMQAYEPPRAAPAFGLPDLDGRVRTLADHRGKALLLFFWTTW
jgi:hypothetical protein